MKIKEFLKKSSKESSFGKGKVEIHNIRNFVNESYKGSYLEFDIEYVFNEKLPKNSVIAYYLTDLKGNDISNVDSTCNFEGKKFSDLKGKVKDHILLWVPEDVEDGNYVVTSFIFPTNGFEFDGNGLRMKIGDVQINGLEKDVNKIYAKYKTHDNSRFYKAYCEIVKDGFDNPLLDTYFQFAFSTNYRGELVINEILPFKNINGTFCMDIGCAYGGFLVAFHNAGADEVIGIDISEQLLSLAKENLKDKKVKNISLLQQDITEFNGLEKWEGMVDVITCNDVIEHVKSPIKAVENIYRLLKPGGIAFFQIPNKFYPEFLLKDGHYGLPLITLLDRVSAELYFIKEGNVDYTVEFYLDFEEYKYLFESFGFNVEVLDSSYESYNFENTKMEVQNIIEKRDTLLSQLPANMVPYTSEKLDQYLTYFSRLEDNDVAIKEIFGASFWKFLLKKPE